MYNVPTFRNLSTNTPPVHLNCHYNVTSLSDCQSVQAMMSTHLLAFLLLTKHRQVYKCPYFSPNTYRSTMVPPFHQTDIRGSSSLKNPEGGGGGREGFWKCVGRGVNMLLKCICRVVYNKSKCGSGGER